MRPLILNALLVALAAHGAAQQQKIDPARIVRLDRQDLAVADFKAEGYILDIGGGGEGIIGRMKPQQTVAIDLYKNELQESPQGPLKIIMDASDLKFLDASFDTVTAFFSLMYMKPDIQEKVFAEAFRVMRPNGRLLIWDATIPTAPDGNSDVVIYYFTFKLPKEEVRTGYGTRWPERTLDVAHYRSLAEKAGFVVQSTSEQGRTFKMELRKP
ncbi:MAG TPA: methyltransferase domain-containing protein [Bryobacteraceae bacterium]|nr:methyltransferase domain-containing protein [Bryobacteraceae bacterium]